MEELHSSDPFKFAKELVRLSVKLDYTQEEMILYLKQTYDDLPRERDLGDCRMLIDPPDAGVLFDM